MHAVRLLTRPGGQREARLGYGAPPLPRPAGPVPPRPAPIACSPPPVAETRRFVATDDHATRPRRQQQHGTPRPPPSLPSSHSLQSSRVEPPAPPGSLHSVNTRVVATRRLLYFAGISSRSDGRKRSLQRAGEQLRRVPRPRCAAPAPSRVPYGPWTRPDPLPACPWSPPPHVRFRDVCMLHLRFALLHFRWVL